MREKALVIALSGKIDSTNAPELEARAFDMLASAQDGDLVFDARDLQYISSAGLRVLMKARKAVGHAPEIRNVSPEVYEILEMTGFTELMNVKKRLREVSVDGCPIIGRGYYGTVYRLDADTIVKVYASPDSIPLIENERKMARLAFIKGIPTAISYDIVKVGDSYGSVFELIKAETLNDALIARPERAEEIIGTFVDVLKSVHAAVLEPGVVPSAKETWLKYLEQDRSHGLIDARQYARLRPLLLAIPESDHAVHGDYHMKNVMLADGEPMLIDMDTLAAGDPIFDLQGVYVTYKAYTEDDPGNSMAFLGIDNAMCNRIWRETLAKYFATDDPEALARQGDKIRLVAAIRFLFLLDDEEGTRDALTEKRIRHAQRHIDELLERVDSLCLEYQGRQFSEEP